MISRLSLLLLLASSTVALAQPLYKWVESDGSVTFSPRPPENGVHYERVNPDNTPTVRDNSRSGSPAEDKQNSPTDSSRSTASPSPAAAMPRVEYAPGKASELPPAVTRSPTQPSAASGLSPVNSALAVRQARLDAARNPQAETGISANSSAASFKQNRCQDLKKRVTSLERRLQSRLTPEDMDNTVIHMARYQQSFDQYCVQ